MSLKLFGALLIVIACGGFGFKLASERIYEEKTLRQLLILLEYMHCELQYRRTALPSLCAQAANESKGVISKVFLCLSKELESRVFDDAQQCMKTVLTQVKDIPNSTYKALEQFAQTLGQFDIDGQLNGIEAVRQECRRNLELLSKDRDVHIRTYQTLGLCAGAAIAILFI